MILAGKGVYQIADILRAEQILIPGAHWKKLGIMCCQNRERVREASAVQQEETAKASRKRLSKGKKRCAELDGLIKKLYENLVAG